MALNFASASSESLSAAFSAGDAAGRFLVFGWFYYAGTPPAGVQAVFSMADIESDTVYFRVYIDTSGNLILNHRNSTTISVTLGACATGWNLWVVAKEAGTGALHGTINGEAEETTAGNSTGAANWDTISVGAGLKATPALFLDGEIASCGCYLNTAVVTTDIQSALWNGGTPMPITSLESAPTHWWRLDKADSTDNVAGTEDEIMDEVGDWDLTTIGGTPNWTTRAAPYSYNLPPEITLGSSLVSVATTTGGSPEQDALLFDGTAVANVDDDNVTAVLVIADPTKANLTGTLPAGWTEDPSGTFTRTATSVAQLTTDLNALLLRGAVVGETTATLTVTDTAAAEDTAVVTISVVAPDLSTTVESGGTFDFGTVEISTEDSQQFTLWNNGTADLEIGTVSISGTGFSIDAGDNPSDTTVVAGASTTVTVLAEFSSGGSKTGALSIASNDADTPYVINLTATVSSTGGPGLLNSPFRFG